MSGHRHFHRTTFATAWIALAAACGDSGAAPSTSGTAGGPASVGLSASAATSAAQAERVLKSEGIQPVYPIDNKPPLPAAERFCDAIHILPAKRKADCCGGTGRSALHAGCVRTLSSALRSGALTVDDAALKACETAAAKAMEGCAWVGLAAPPLPIECVGLFKGTVKENGTCRSSMECEGNLTCYMLGATKPGTCMKPRPKDAVCNTGTDTLASDTRQSQTDFDHPTCEGACSARRCVEAVPVGGACKSRVECGPKASCVAGKCESAPLPSEGKPCATGDCAHGLRCIADVCVKGGLEGASCKTDVECIGACENGSCVKRCTVTPGFVPNLVGSLVPRASASAK